MAYILIILSLFIVIQMKPLFIDSVSQLLGIQHKTKHHYKK